jgi:hypothetical protein
VSYGATLATVPEVDDFDVRTPYEELTELRTLLAVGEIAEMTGLRRETLSRARPDGRFQRRTERGIAALYLVVTRLRPSVGADVHLAAVLRRPQEVLGRRSIAELLAEGKVATVLEHLAEPEPDEGDRPASSNGMPSDLPVEGPDERLAALLTNDPELESRLPAIEAAVLERFGPGASLERKIIEPWDVPEGGDQFYLRVNTDLSFEENVDRLSQLLRQEKALLAPVRRQLTIGFLG